VTRTDPSIRRIIRPDAFENWKVFFTDAKSVEARTRFAERRARADGTYLDSAAIAAIGAPTALGLVLRAPGVQPFVVPASLPAPSRDDDFALAAAWRPGVTLPMMALPAARSATVPAADSTAPVIALCFPKIYLDGRVFPLRMEELQQLRSVQLATMSVHAPNSAVALQTRFEGLTFLSKNRCGVVQLQSYIHYP
jgi:hypothetical protein